MNRIPKIAAAIAIVALLLAAYLALSSRIARLEEALGSSNGDVTGADAASEFAALGYNGMGVLRLRLSPRMSAVAATSATAGTEAAALTKTTVEAAPAASR